MQTSTQDNSTDTVSRQLAICALIRDLRAARSLPPFTPSELQKAGAAWDAVLTPIETGYLTSRDGVSLFAAAAHAGYIEVRQIWNLWEATMGSEIRVEANEERLDQRDMRDHATQMAQSRADIRAWLAARGY